MASVGAAIITDHDIVMIGKDINDFTLGLITPLKSNNTGARHTSSPYLKKERDCPMKKTHTRKKPKTPVPGNDTLKRVSDINSYLETMVKSSI